MDQWSSEYIDGDMQKERLNNKVWVRVLVSVCITMGLSTLRHRTDDIPYPSSNSIAVLQGVSSSSSTIVTVGVWSGHKDG